MRIKLFQSSLVNYPSNEALSYVWGAGYGDHQVECEGRSLPVTRNCIEALRQLRCSEARILWIDAVCVDQGNSEGRSQQVRRMREIYGKAHQVVVWLGVRPADSGLGIEVVQLFDKLIQDFDGRGQKLEPEHPELQQALDVPALRLGIKAIAELPW